MSKHSLFAASALALAISAAWAQPAPAPVQSPGSVEVIGLRPAPIEDYVKLPAFATPRLSPDGRYLAVSVPVNGKMNLAVVDLETRKGTAITNFSEFDVLGAHWVGNERLVFNLGQVNSPTGPEQFDGGGLFMVSRDGKESKKIAPTVREARESNQRYRNMEFLQTIPGNPNEILVTANIRSADSEDVYRLDLKSGRTTLVSGERPLFASGWILDNTGAPRVVTSWVENTLTFVVHYRASVDAPWKEIGRNERASGTAFHPLGFLSDNKTLMVASNAGRDTMAIYRFDPETRQFGEILAQHPKYDVGADVEGNPAGNVITEPETDRVLGFVVNADKPQTVWIDEKEARTQATIDKALPGMRNAFRRFPNSSRVLISSYSDVSPEKFFLLDEQKKTLEELFTSKPWLAKDRLVEMRPFILKTRDGLEIPSYYFLPRSYKPGDKLPTVLHVHGGPHVRADTWARGFGYMEAEILASRGYAVVLPNFRVTPGFGGKIFKAGMGTIGRQMSEDHEDAVKWAVEQGFADPNRVCISGASYGGYAVLRALAKTPDLFKCGIAGLVVSDLEMQLTSTAGDTSRSDAGVKFWYQLVGQNDANKTALRDNSPVTMARQMKAPLFMYAGAADIRTPPEQTRAMVSALERAGNPPKAVIIKSEEGHGFGRVENNVELYTRMLDFLDENIGPKAR
ncbi:MAG: S9 family peptidase [Burkholderiales bacterium]|nr:S9 family peptidase [Burkholderiales bacterium]